MKLRRKIAKNFKIFRESLSLSQDDFAEKVGVSKDTIGKIEKAQSSLTDNVLSRVVKAFNIQASYFYTFEKINLSDSTSEKIEALTEKLKTLGDNELILIDNIINNIKNYNEHKNS